MIKNLLERWLGLSKIRAEAEEARKYAEEAKLAAESALKAEELAKMVPKDRATARGEPWVTVLNTHVNKENIRNGFFELDWNDEFVVQLKKGGYGFDGDPDEEIVDRWFRDLARNMLAEEGLDPSRGAGYLNFNRANND